MPLEHIVVDHAPTNQPITHAVIWLHGLGASGHDFEPIVPQLGLREDLGVRFVFPHAPSRPVTVNGGMSMPAWYDILAISIERHVDETQIQTSSEQVMALVNQQVEAGIRIQNIVIAGFSQGGAVAYHTVINHNEPFAGLLALSTYVATEASLKWHPANRHAPIRIDHGTQDPVVPLMLGQKAKDVLTQKGYSVDFNTYPMGHQVCLEQISSIGKWFNKVLN